MWFVDTLAMRGSSGVQGAAVHIGDHEAVLHRITSHPVKSRIKRHGKRLVPRLQPVFRGKNWSYEEPPSKDETKTRIMTRATTIPTYHETIRAGVEVDGRHTASFPSHLAARTSTLPRWTRSRLSRLPPSTATPRTSSRRGWPHSCVLPPL